MARVSAWHSLGWGEVAHRWLPCWLSGSPGTLAAVKATLIVTVRGGKAGMAWCAADTSWVEARDAATHLTSQDAAPEVRCRESLGVNWGHIHGRATASCLEE